MTRPIDLPCPKCGAPASQRCRQPSGATAEIPHSARKLDAMVADGDREAARIKAARVKLTRVNQQETGNANRNV